MAVDQWPLATAGTADMDDIEAVGALGDGGHLYAGLADGGERLGQFQLPPIVTAAFNAQTTHERFVAGSRTRRGCVHGGGNL